MTCIGIAGLSHLGLNTGIGFAAKGFTVIGYDSDTRLVQALGEARFPIFEPGLEDAYKEHKHRITFSADKSSLAACDIMYIAKDIPTNDQNESDTSAVQDLCKDVFAAAKEKTSVVLHSQVSPGFTRALLGDLQKAFAHKNISVFYQVETLIFGQALDRVLKPERYIVGCLNPQASLPPAYAELLQAFGCPILPMRYESAELAKISINLFLVSSVITTNVLAEICEHNGAEWPEIERALRLDKRIGPHAYLNPGLGIAGGNLERDLVSILTLSKDFGTESSTVSTWLHNSSYRKDWPLRVLHREVLAQNSSASLAVWGLAYKVGTHSTKNAPSLSFLRALKSKPVSVYDPLVRIDASEFPQVTQAESPIACAKGAHALVVFTGWEECRTADLKKLREQMRGNTIIDPLGVLHHEQCEKLGFQHFRFGSTFEAPRQCT